MRGFSNSSAARSLRLLCTQNPFYVVSAVLVLYGLRQCTAGEADVAGGWLLMGVICGYTLLLAAAAAFIIRAARVWDDARMILLVLVLLFLALSVSFDKLVLANPLSGAPLLLAGLLFSLTVSQGLLRMLGMRLAREYRWPYYLMLVLLFVYPLGLAWLSSSGFDPALAWGVYLFPWLAGAAFLSLIPAARRGHRDRQSNGTPWRWPLYPWSLFVFLWVCFALRTYSISFAFEAPRDLQAVFEPHFFTPLVLAAAVLLLEIGVAANRRIVQRVAMIAPLSAMALALIDSNASDTIFAQTLREAVGSPVQIVCWSLLAFYGVAWLRGVRLAEAALVAVLLLFSVVSAETVNIATFVAPRPFPLEAAAVLMIAIGLVQKRKWKGVFGGVLLIVSSSQRDSGLVYALVTMHHGYYALHLSALVILLAAVIGRDRFSQTVGRIAFILLPAAACFAAAVYDQIYPSVPAPLHMLYIMGLAMAAWGFWERRQLTRNLAGALATSAACTMTPAKRAYLLLQATALEEALPYLAVGLFLLVLAVLVSLYKGGLLPRCWSALERLNSQLRRQPSG